MIRVVVADDEAMVRAGLVLIVRAQPDIEVVGEAQDGIEAMQVVARERPDVVLMDIRMPRLDGLEATRRILADPTGPAPRVIVLTTFDFDAYVYEALVAGASGFLLKESPPEQLISGIRVAFAGDALLAPSVTRRLIEQHLRRRAKASLNANALDELTPREREVLALVARGLSNAEIASELVVSEATVKTHVSHLLLKLHLRDRAQAVVLAYESGLVRAAIEQ